MPTSARPTRVPIGTPARAVIVGAGYVGLTTGVALAQHGHAVTLVDVDAQKLDRIRKGEAPFFEPGLDALLASHVASGALAATTDLAAAARVADIIFLCVGTPQSPTGAADLTFLRRAADAIGNAVRGSARPPVVVTKSTVPPGTGRDVIARALGGGIPYASNPEFLKEGAAMHDAMHPDRIVVGADVPGVAERVWALYEGFSCPKLTVDVSTAETIKYAANAFLATKVALANELANVAAANGVDWYRVAEGIGHDPRIGPLFLRAGAGFGGSCFPKDVAGFAHIAREAGTPSRILDAVLATNEEQPLITLRLLREEIGSLEGKRIALLGLAFKPDTDDVRESRAFSIYEALLKEGAEAILHDPKASSNFARLAPKANLAATVQDALRGADGCIVQTEWSEYRALAPTVFCKLMRAPVIIDGRRTFDADIFRAAGVRYRAIGLGALRE